MPISLILGGASNKEEPYEFDRLFSPLERISGLRNRIRDPRKFSSSDGPDTESDMLKADMEKDFDLIPSHKLFALLDMIENTLQKRKKDFQQ